MRLYLSLEIHVSRTYHHLGNHCTRFRIQVIEFGILWLDLCGVNLGVANNNARPPLHAVDFGQFQCHHITFFGPNTLVGFDFLVQRTLRVRINTVTLMHIFVCESNRIRDSLSLSLCVCVCACVCVCVCVFMAGDA
jgi:hypothetical protein